MAKSNINITIDFNESVKSLLKLKLQTVSYKDLQEMHNLLYEELKKRDASLPFSSLPTGDYHKK